MPCGSAPTPAIAHADKATSRCIRDTGAGPKSSSRGNSKVQNERSIEGVLRLYYFVAFGALGLYLPYFPSWLAARGFVGWRMSALVALLPLCQLASPTLVGLLADKWAIRGRMMTLCGAFTAAGLSGLCLVSFAFPRIPFWVAFVCVLAFASLRSPTIGLADVLSMEASRDYGRTRLWGSIGFMVMAMLGGHFIDPVHPSELPVGLAAMMWTMVLVSCFLPKTSHLPPRPALSDARALLQQSGYRHLLLTMVLIFASMSAYDLCSTLHLVDLGASGTYVGAFWTIATFAEVIVMFFSARLVQHLRPGRALRLACGVMVLRWALLSTVSSLKLLLLLQPLHALTFGLMWVSAIGVLKRELGEKGTATAHGLFSSSNALGAAAGLSIWGVLYQATSGATVFALAAVVVSLATASAHRLVRSSSGPSPEGSDRGAARQST